MKKRGLSQVVEVMILVLIGIVLVVGLFIFIRFEIGSRGEISEIMSRLADEHMEIDSVKGDFENPSIFTLDLGRGAGVQTLKDYNFSQYNYTVINITANKTLVNVTIPIYWNETIEEKWNETVAVYWNETITITNNESANYSTVSVADVSGSMVGTPINELKTATKSFIDNVLNNSGNEMGLVAYSDGAYDISTLSIYGFDWSHTLSNDNASLKSKVNLWYATYSTCICCGVNKAIEYLKDSTKPKIMVVMSDGQANVRCVWTGYINATYYEYAKIDAIEAARNASENYGIKVYTIGFDTSTGPYAGQLDEETLKQMAAVGNGSYYYASIGELSEIYESIVETTTIEVEHINYTIIEHINYTEVEHINITVIEHVNYTTEIQEIDTPVEILAQDFQGQVFDYLKIVFYSDTDTYIEKIPFSELPGPLEFKKINIDLKGKIANVKKIEIYPIALTSKGKEVTGPLLAIWDVENDVV